MQIDTDGRNTPDRYRTSLYELRPLGKEENPFTTRARNLRTAPRTDRLDFDRASSTTRRDFRFYYRVRFPLALRSCPIRGRGLYGANRGSSSC